MRRLGRISLVTISVLMIASLAIGGHEKEAQSAAGKAKYMPEITMWRNWPIWI